MVSHFLWILVGLFDPGGRGEISKKWLAYVGKVTKVML